MPAKSKDEKPRKVRAGQRLIAVYVSDELGARLEARVKGLLARRIKTSLKGEVVQAIERHLAYPPPDPDPTPAPLPDAPKRKPGRPKKNP
jgi:hypothetical protein